MFGKIFKWSFIHAAFLGVNLIALLIFTLGFGFSDSVPHFLTIVAKVWGMFIEVLMFPMSHYIDFLVESVWNAELFYMLSYVVNSLLWGTAITLLVSALRKARP
ncbi:hypothetical protein RN22_14655 [Grimontia sp. AD028]|uniref:hypothetical protein n=1 Tax=Grimontia sp. AD028 TaxID=1581149 RepID=UPI00061AB69F|nr:hypothetical protein [Grimontia sp. AD028]KKD59679.1 hypothetical protein RN22_14655 [Grimontia sp. AD028]